MSKSHKTNLMQPVKFQLLEYITWFKTKGIWEISKIVVYLETSLSTLFTQPYLTVLWMATVAPMQLRAAEAAY